MNVLQPVRRGFTLIELLVVIAIIAILAAILFPVFARVREQARQTSCFSNMHEIYVALRLYREDNNKYPAVLMGFVQNDDKTATTDATFYPGAVPNPAPIVRLTYRPLNIGQKYLTNDPSIFVCPDSTHSTLEDLSPTTGLTTAQYPLALTGPDINTGITYRSGANQEYTKLLKDNCCRAVPYNQANPNTGADIWYYKYDSYDIGPQINRNGVVLPNPTNPTWEVHYALDWTGPNYTGPADQQNQLKYPNAPEDRTVITWCTYHAAYAGSDKVLVLLLNGKVRATPTAEFIPRGPLNLIP